jgi:hypothetical protein
MEALADRLSGMGDADLELTAEAKAAFVKLYNATGLAEWTEGDDDQRAALAKGPRLALRLALIHHCVTLAAGIESTAEADARPVGLASIEFGKLLAEWFIDELERVYLEMNSAGGSDLRQKVTDWANRHHAGRIIPRTMQQSFRRDFAKKADVRAFLDRLAAERVGAWEATDKDERGVFVLSPPEAEPDDE